MADLTKEDRELLDQIEEKLRHIEALLDILILAKTGKHAEQLLREQAAAKPKWAPTRRR